MTIIPKIEQNDNNRAPVWPVQNITESRHDVPPTPLWVINNEKAVAAVADDAPGYATSFQLQQVLETLPHFLETLYYDTSLTRPVLRKTFRLDESYSMIAGDVTDNSTDVLGAFLEKNGLKFKKDALYTAIQLAARGGNKQRESNVFAEMLENAKKHGDVDPGIIHELVTRLGLKDDTYSTAVIQYLLSTIYYKQTYKGDGRDIKAPALNVILYGKQGSGKTEFVKRLTCGHYVDKFSPSDFNNKDFQMKAAGTWVLNDDDMVAESTEKAVAAIKSEITASHYDLRVPYGRSVECVPKRAVHMATTNKYGFLFDTTGDRRSYILEVQAELSGADDKDIKTAGASFVEWFTPQRVLDLWATFEDTMVVDGYPLFMPDDVDIPEVEQRRLELVEEHQLAAPLVIALDAAIEKEFNLVSDPFTGKSAEPIEYVPCKQFNKAVTDELYDMGERTTGRVKEINELMQERGYRIDKHDGRRYRAPQKN